jgi:hypothetical protein
MLYIDILGYPVEKCEEVESIEEGGSAVCLDISTI